MITLKNKLINFKKILFSLPILLVCLLVLPLSSCQDRQIEFYSGSWETNNIVIVDTPIKKFIMTLEYIGGDYYSHNHEENVFRYIYIDEQAYLFSFNLDGEIYYPVSSTYYRKKVYGTGFSYKGYEVYISGVLKQGKDYTYFEGSLMYYVELEDGAYFTPNTSQDIILKEVK